MTEIRFEVPEFVADLCTGCGQCWTQCPDAAIPGLVSEVSDIVRAGVYTAAAENPEGQPSERIKELIAPLAEESRRILKDGEYKSFAGVVTRAWDRLASTLGDDERATLDAEIDAVIRTVADFPVARTVPFFTVPERKEEGSGGLLTVTINPYACKGCNLCVDVSDEALVAVKQEEEIVDKLRRNWEVWNKLPDTPQRFLQISDLDEGIGVLHTLMLKKDNLHSMVGGDGSCMGCGEKTGVHLIVSAIEAAVQPRVAAMVEKLDRLIKELEHKAAELLMVSADL